MNSKFITMERTVPVVSTEIGLYPICRIRRTGVKTLLRSQRVRKRGRAGGWTDSGAIGWTDIGGIKGWTDSCTIGGNRGWTDRQAVAGTKRRG